MFFRKKKQQESYVPFCDHRWEYLSKETETEEHYNGIDSDFYKYEVIYCYCPRCKKREKVNPNEWKLRQLEQKIDEEYKEKLMTEIL